MFCLSDHLTAVAPEPPTGHTLSIAAHLTGDKLVDARALELYQAQPLDARRADRRGVWRQCVAIARDLSRKGAKQ